jgi:hypothetical protein
MMTEKITLHGVECTFTEQTTRVTASWRVAQPYGIKVMVAAFRSRSPEWGTMRGRTERSLRNEWAAHNFLYQLGYETARTADADFERDTGYFKAAAYALLAIAYSCLWRRLINRNK